MIYLAPLPTPKFTVNRVFQYDPTRTLGLRKRYVQAMNGRWNALRAAIVASVDTNDCFGLREEKLTLLAQAPAIVPVPQRAFEFGTDAKKLDGFMDWLREQQDAGLLQVTNRPGVPEGVAPWQHTYIQSAYKQGMKRAQQELRKGGWDIPEPKDAAIDTAFNMPIHADRVALLYGRSFRDLKGITEAMDAQISTILANGMAEGRSPKELARFMRATIEGHGGDLEIKDALGRTIPAKRRAETLARTEIIRAHHQASIMTYRAAGAEGVTVMAEWSTAGDDRVCERCASMEGRVFSLDEVENAIPLHPNCRCIAIPANVGESRFSAIGDANKRREQLGVDPLPQPEEGKTLFGAGEGTRKGMVDSAILAGMSRAEMLEMLERDGVKPGTAKQWVSKRVAEIRKQGWTVTYDKDTGRYVAVPPDGLGTVTPKAGVPAVPVAPARGVPAAVGPPPVTYDIPEFPEDPDNLKVLGPLGGSTGAELVEDQWGREWVRKRGGNKNHLLNEATADALYREAGYNVPDFKVYHKDSDRPVKLARFINGVRLSQLPSTERNAAMRKLGKGFGFDALMGNWDVLGAVGDNVIVDAVGDPWRIDNGGALLYRAAGELKAKPHGVWDQYPRDFWSMRRFKFQKDRWEKAGGVTEANAFNAIRFLDHRLFDRVPMDDTLRSVLKERLKHAKVIGEASRRMIQHGWTADRTSSIMKARMNLRSIGILEVLPEWLRPKKRPNRFGGGLLADIGDLRDEHGKSWGNLRGGTPAQKLTIPVNAVFKEVYKDMSAAIAHSNYKVSKGHVVDWDGFEIDLAKRQMANMKNEKPANAAEKQLVKYMEEKWEAFKKKSQNLQHYNGWASWQWYKDYKLTDEVRMTGDFSPMELMEDFFEAEGIASDKRQLHGEWQGSHAGSSTWPPAQGFMYWLRQGREDERLGQQADEDEGMNWYMAKDCGTGGQGDFVLSHHQALMQELLEKTAFKGNDRDRHLMRILRVDTEDDFGYGRINAAPNTDVQLERQWNSSGSVFRPFSHMGETVTETAVPHDMVTGSYFLEREANYGGPAFADNVENEFTFFSTHDMPTHVYGSTEDYENTIDYLNEDGDQDDAMDWAAPHRYAENKIR